MTLKKNKETSNNELEKDMKEFMEKHKIIGLWLATPDTSADLFLDEATMYRFICSAHEVEKAYDSFVESKAMARISKKKTKTTKSSDKESNYFG